MRDVRSHASVDYVAAALKSAVGDTIEGCSYVVTSVALNDTGRYKKVTGLPPFIDVRITVQCGKAARPELVTVWSPIKWNGRFAGTAGGGECTGGETYITPPKNTDRGWNLPYAVMKGYTAATADGGNIQGLTDYIVNPRTGAFDIDLYENWKSRSTHHMAVIGRAVAEILHDRKVEYSYMNGSSGGGRQSLVEAQEFPEDFNGIWASCPAINWNRFNLVGLWDVAVMNDRHHLITPKSLERISQAARDAAGGDDAYYRLGTQPPFDAYSAVGRNGITREDAEIAGLLWNGPTAPDGSRLWYGYRPGVKFWYIGLPVTALYYSIIGHRPRPCIMAPILCSWIEKEPKRKWDNITLSQFYRIFEQSVNKLSDAGCDNPDLTKFAARGGKLIIDHGLNDPIISVDGTIDYYNSYFAACK